MTKIHGKSSVPWRRRLAQIAHASVSEANHYGVAVTGSSPFRRWRRGDAWQERNNGADGWRETSSTRYSTLELLCAFTHAGWLHAAGYHGKVRQDGAARATRARAAVDRVKGSFGAAGATLKRMQWTTLEHDPFQWCMHDGRTVDPGRVCPHSMHTLLKKGGAGVTKAARGAA